MANVNYTGKNAVLVSGAKYLVATILGEADAEGDTYIFDHVLKDSTSMQQDDNDVQEVANEFKAENIKEIVTLGKWNFTSTIEDMQKDLVTKFCGFEASSDGKKVYAPANYSARYAKIAVVLDGGNDKLIAFILPKVQLNTKIILESLSSSMAGFTLAGTGKSIYYDPEHPSKQSPFYIDYEYTLPVASS